LIPFSMLDSPPEPCVYFCVIELIPMKFIYNFCVPKGIFL
jgi:hypothetical protein